MFFNRLAQHIKSIVVHVMGKVEAWVKQWTKPRTESLVVGAWLDMTRSKGALTAANALLRQPGIILQRQVKRPQITPRDRRLLVRLARWTRHWRAALAIVKPDALLGWHRQGFRSYWRRKSRSITREPRISQETIDLLKQMAVENRGWGAKRILGELKKLGIHVSKRTVQRHMRQARKKVPARRSGQTWATFLRNQAQDIWACDFLQVYDLLFRPLFLFFSVELGSRRVVHCGVTRAPRDAWVAQQLREATPFGEGPQYLIHDHDAKFGDLFRRAGGGIKLLKTPVHAPQANAICERFLGSVRRECLDHLLMLSERHLRRLGAAYVAYFNQARPHQGIAQQIPACIGQVSTSTSTGQPVLSRPVLGGLHHDDYRAA